MATRRVDGSETRTNCPGVVLLSVGMWSETQQIIFPRFLGRKLSSCSCSSNRLQTGFLSVSERQRRQCANSSLCSLSFGSSNQFLASRTQNRCYDCTPHTHTHTPHAGAVNTGCNYDLRFCIDLTLGAKFLFCAGLHWLVREKAHGELARDVNQ